MDSDQNLHLQPINQAQQETSQQHRPLVLRKTDRTQLCRAILSHDGICHHEKTYGFPCPYSHEPVEVRNAKAGRIPLLLEINMESFQKLRESHSTITEQNKILTDSQADDHQLSNNYKHKSRISRLSSSLFKKT